MVEVECNWVTLKRSERSKLLKTSFMMQQLSWLLSQITHLSSHIIQN